ncbi:hypothetical protein A2U01_0004074 [Trifolium medium]|uniref:Uncharacterized protein n=1 Tax=Trifolium medium TaxID=97028 RepID=A0A392M764_9FABA|nr:hypothetical protein [Trifolium medium]
MEGRGEESRSLRFGCVSFTAVFVALGLLVNPFGSVHTVTSALPDGGRFVSLKVVAIPPWRQLFRHGLVVSGLGFEITSCF